MQSSSSNFAFLQSHDPRLAKLPALAEESFATEPTAALWRLRQFGEILTRRVAAAVGQYQPGEEQAKLISRLRYDGFLPHRTADLLHGIRKAGNAAVHEDVGDHATALYQLKMARQVAIWFHKTFGRVPGFKAGPFVPPQPPKDPTAELTTELEELKAKLAEAQETAELAQLQAQEEAEKAKSAEEAAAAAAAEAALIEELALENEKELAAKVETAMAELQAQASKQPKAEIDAVVEAAHIADDEIDLSEADTRKIIDEQLREAGWVVDSATRTHGKGERPEKGVNKAISEWPCKSGPVDYALWIGKRLVGVIEAKRKFKDIPSALGQAKRYAEGISLDGDGEYVEGGPWGSKKYRVPFLYATNGRPYLEQLKEKSGIWFWDSRLKRPSKALPGWHSPEDLENRITQDAAGAAERLKEEPLDYLGLRDYQQEAILAVEDAIADNQDRIMLAMATGTGKTRTAIGLIYRLIKSKRFRRVLFLVDRSTLGTQAKDSFDTAKLEQLKSFSEIYDVKGLADIEPDIDTRLHFATVQSMMMRILYPNESRGMPSVGTYDCVVVDECHRGYNLDRELSDAELTFRNEADYISKYRRVLDYFDATAIGLTATPAAHTAAIFGNPVFIYGYRDAVVDGHLIDYEPPIRIGTKLQRDGIGFTAGEKVERYNPQAPTQLDLIEMPDEVQFEVDAFNKRVITENFNRAVCQELTKHIDPSLDAKTLVFAANRDHGDMVVRLLKEAFVERYGEVDDDAVKRITGDIDRPDVAIRRFKNERLPNVVVTVDLLTTGIDVPSICNLVFLRRVRSRILYEQMLGRATRRCDDIEKEYFRIYDCVDLYDALEPFTSMKAVAKNPKLSFEQLVKELQTVDDDDAQQQILDQIVTKLRVKGRHLKGAKRQDFIDLTGGEPREIADSLRKGGVQEAKAWFAAHDTLPSFLDKAKGPKPKAFISYHEDEVISVEQGFGKHKRPEDFLDAFKAYIEEHMNDLPALLVVTQRPRELTRAELKKLKLALDSEGFSELALRKAYEQTTNKEIAASIMGYIRQRALGEALVPYDERVDKAVAKIMSENDFNKPQKDWLKRIAKQMKTELIVDRAALDRGQFKAKGGFARINKVFEGKLEALLGDLRAATWNQAG